MLNPSYFWIRQSLSVAKMCLKLIQLLITQSNREA